MAIRRIFIEEGEMVEIRIVPVGTPKTVKDWEYAPSWQATKYLMKFHASGVNLCIPQSFNFMIADKSIHYLPNPP